MHLKELITEPSKSYEDSKQVVFDWLTQIENSLKTDDCQITFLSILDAKLQFYKVNYQII